MSQNLTDELVATISVGNHKGTGSSCQLAISSFFLSPYKHICFTFPSTRNRRSMLSAPAHPSERLSSAATGLGREIRDTEHGTDHGCTHARWLSPRPSYPCRRIREGTSQTPPSACLRDDGDFAWLHFSAILTYSPFFLASHPNL